MSNFVGGVIFGCMGASFVFFMFMLMRFVIGCVQWVVLLVLNHDYTEEDEKDELQVLLFILIIFFSVIMVQKIE